jgi:hypothetical protein
LICRRGQSPSPNEGAGVGGGISRFHRHKGFQKKTKKYFKKFLLQYITFFVKNLRMSFFFHIFALDLIQDMCVNA